MAAVLGMAAGSMCALTLYLAVYGDGPLPAFWFNVVLMSASVGALFMLALDAVVNGARKRKD